MELIKQLAEAKAQGLNKEEFFHLLEIEVKLNESKKQYPSVSGDIPVTSASGDDFTRLEKVLQDVSSKLNSQQQQLSAVHQSLVELQQQQRQQSQPLQHLQQQQQGQLQKQQQEVQQLIHQQLQQHQQHVQQHLQQQLQQHLQLTQQMVQKQEQHQQQVQQLLQQQEQHLQYQHQIQNQQLQQHVQQIQQHLQQWQTHQLPQSMHQQPQQPQLQQQQQQQQFQQQLENALHEITEQFKQQDKTLDQKHQHIKDDFHEMRSTVLNKLEEEKIYMKDELSRAQNELLASLSKLGDLVGQVREKVGTDAYASIENQIAQLLCFGEQQRVAQEKQEKRDGEIKDMLKSLFTVQENLSHKCLVPATAKVQKTETEGEMEVKELVKDLKTEVHDTRKDLLAVVGTEAQLVRDQIATSYRPRPRKQQVFDFYVENFEQHINSGPDVFRIESLSVFVDHFQSVLKGSVVLVRGDSMEVWILYARNPRKFGLQIRAGVKVNIRSAVKDLSGKLPDIVIGTEKCTLDENVIKDNEDNWGVKIGTVKCADIIDRGYNKLYQSGAILIRFNIDAL